LKGGTDDGSFSSFLDNYESSAPSLDHTTAHRAKIKPGKRRAPTRKPFQQREVERRNREKQEEEENAGLVEDLGDREIVERVAERPNLPAKVQAARATHVAQATQAVRRRPPPHMGAGMGFDVRLSQITRVKNTLGFAKPSPYAARGRRGRGPKIGARSRATPPGRKGKRGIKKGVKKGMPRSLRGKGKKRGRGKGPTRPIGRGISKGRLESDPLITIVQARADFSGQRDGDLSLKSGEKFILVGKKGQWWMGKKGTKTGLFPSNFVKVIYEKRESQREKVCALASYKAKPTAKKHLSFNKGEVFYLVDKEKDPWWTGEKDGVVGLFPSNYVKKDGGNGNTPTKPASVTKPTGPKETKNVTRKPVEDKPKPEPEPEKKEEEGFFVKAKFNFAAKEDGDLDLKKGNVVRVIESTGVIPRFVFSLSSLFFSSFGGKESLKEEQDHSLPIMLKKLRRRKKNSLQKNKVNQCHLLIRLKQKMISLVICRI